MSNKLKVLLVGILSIILLSTIAFASSTTTNSKQGNTVSVPGSEKVVGAAFYSGNDVIVDANIDGTAFAAGNNVTVNGDIDGDLFVAGNTVTVNGKVTGNIYGAGSTVTVSGEIERDAFLAGNILTLSEGSKIGRDVLIGAAKTNFGAEVGRNATIAVDEFITQESFKVGNNLEIASSMAKDPSIESKVGGTTTWKKVDTSSDKPAEKVGIGAVILAKVLSIILSTAGSLLLWAVVRYLKPNFWRKNRIVGENNIGKSFGVGIVSLIVLPIIFGLLLFTVIGISTSIIGGLLLAITIYISKIVVAEIIGNKILKPKAGKELHFGVWAVLLGLVIINILTKIPFIGWLVVLAVVIFGVGAILLRMYREKDEVPVFDGEVVIEKEI